METILISGATGFVGKNLLERFAVENKYRIIAYVLEGDFKGIEFLKNNKIEFITKLDSKAINKIDYCIHLASYGVAIEDKNIETMVDSNLKLPLRLAEFCAFKGCQLFVNTGSCFEYGSLINDRKIREDDKLSPDDIYASSKVACEDFLKVYCKLLKMKLLTIRPFSMYGKYERETRLMPLIFDAGYNKKHLSLTGGEQIRDYMDVKDVAFSICKIIENIDRINDIESINICSGKALKLKDFIDLIVRTCDFDPSLFGFHEKEYRQNESMYFVGDNTLLFKVIGEQDFSLTPKKITNSYNDYLKNLK